MTRALVLCATIIQPLLQWYDRMRIQDTLNNCPQYGYRLLYNSDSGGAGQGNFDRLYQESSEYYGPATLCPHLPHCDGVSSGSQRRFFNGEPFCASEFSAASLFFPELIQPLANVR